ncbi:MAG TPA: cytochrome c [Alcaligenes sp.]|nr:cytochrome c [Alcaligenes sp.]HRL28133.1 cytochrome c [Alcaligenes sp.]
MPTALTLPTRLLCILLALLPCLSQANPPSPERQRILTHLLRQECGSCHGLKLDGGLGPALTHSALTGRTIEQLAHVILQGRPGTAMPGWQAFIQPAEAVWLADLLLNPPSGQP